MCRECGKTAGERDKPVVSMVVVGTVAGAKTNVHPPPGQLSHHHHHQIIAITSAT
jgi:hypothetical protein